MKVYVEIAGQNFFSRQREVEDGGQKKSGNAQASQRHDSGVRNENRLIDTYPPYDCYVYGIFETF